MYMLACYDKNTFAVIGLYLYNGQTDEDAEGYAIYTFHIPCMVTSQSSVCTFVV